ncbi:hypothetical protein [Paraburkholderia lycopersici]|uniref:Phage integrase family protein n=1 Tax=Paraburkholderia lycopersici TaxID=416944 RepID=A0A1G6M2Z3_9BURK|nr:hypothetical protein [Paraburkholderia lycopersici]SDC49684.1 hypothetical protein SAMN05421548_107111 [Paraburkholderia lycopersici]
MPNEEFAPEDLGFPATGCDPKSWFKNLGVFLYEGGASMHPERFAQAISKNEMGPPLLDRLPLLQALHRTLSALHSARKGELALESRITRLRMLYRFAERTGEPINMDTVVDIFLAWSQSLIRRTELTDDGGQYDRDLRPLSHPAAYQYCGTVARVLDLALKPVQNLMSLTNLKPLPRGAPNNSGKHEQPPANLTAGPQSTVPMETRTQHGVCVNLTFNGVNFGERDVPWNLNVLLYRGGAAAKARDVQTLISSGALGPPLYERLRLVRELHDELAARLAAGGSPHSTSDSIVGLRKFFQFADENNLSMTRETAVDAFCLWANSLVHRAQLSRDNSRHRKGKRKQSLKKSSAYKYGRSVAAPLNVVLERHTNVIELTRLKPPRQRKTAIGVQAEKQSLSDTFSFGHVLQDVCDALTIETIRVAPLPVVIALRSGELVPCDGSNAWAKMDQTTRLGKRYRLANIRIEAELCMFIGQTGMNLSQAHELTLRHFFYTGHIDSYQVRDHKGRRGGAVLFEIFKEYKPHFERYLEWRRTIFPHTDRLFPFIRQNGSLADTKFFGTLIQIVCKHAKVTYVPPQMLRGTRVNWFLRQTADPEITAEIGQHTTRTLLNAYHRPSLQRALGESTIFWQSVDPHSALPQAVGPGDCAGKEPKQSEQHPPGAPKPDCRRASGCLWCLNHRDVDSFDYIWALVTFKHLKTIELGKGAIPKKGDADPPSKAVIDRVDEKLRAFSESNEQRRGWVIEAELRIDEEDFHPSFSDEINESEGVA